MLQKITLFCVYNCVLMRLEVQKTHDFPHTVHYCSSMPNLSETHRFLQSSSFWEARRALIGQLFGALWLAEYLKRLMEMLYPLPYCDAVSRCSVDLSYPVRFSYLPLKQWLVQYDNVVKMLPFKLCFSNVYTYHNLKPTLTLTHIQ